MNPDPYSNRELEYRFKEIAERDDVILAKLSDVHAEVKKTNGRVKNLEVWRGAMAGGMAVITAIILPILVTVALQALPKP